MAFDPANCEFFISDCGKKFSPQELFNMLVGTDDDGCPVFKVKDYNSDSNASSLLTLTRYGRNLQTAIFSGGTMTILKGQMDGFLTTGPIPNVVHMSLSFDGVNHNALILYK